MDFQFLTQRRVKFNISMHKRKVYILILFLLILIFFFFKKPVIINQSIHSSPKISIENIPSELRQFQLFTIKVLLENNGEESLRQDWAAGIHLRLLNATFIRIDKGEFKGIVTFILRNNNVYEAPIVGSNIVELWADSISSNEYLKSGEICILVPNNVTNVQIEYRAWIMDKNDKVYCDLHATYEPYISRDPIDVTDDRFNGLPYFLFYKTYRVIIPVNGLYTKDEIDVCQIKIAVNPNGYADVIYNFNYICKSPGKELKIWIHAPITKVDFIEYQGLILPLMAKTISTNVTEIRVSRWVNGKFINEINIERDGSWIILVIKNPNTIESISLSFRLMDYVKKDFIFYEFGLVIFSPNFVLVHSLNITSSIQFSYWINSHTEYAILTRYFQDRWYQQSFKLPDKVRFINRVINIEYYIMDFSENSEIDICAYASNLYIIGNWGRPVFWLFVWGCIISFALISFFSLIGKLSFKLSSYLVCFIIIVIDLKIMAIPYIDILNVLFLSTIPAFLLYLVLCALQTISINIVKAILQLFKHSKKHIGKYFNRFLIKEVPIWILQILSQLIICFPLLVIGYFLFSYSSISTLIQIIILFILFSCMIIYGLLYFHIQKLHIKSFAKDISQVTHDKYIVINTNNIEEAVKLLENGFEYICEIDGHKLFRKRKITHNNS